MCKTERTLKHRRRHSNRGVFDEEYQSFLVRVHVCIDLRVRVCVVRARRHCVGQGTSPPCRAGHIATMSARARLSGRARRHRVGQDTLPPCRAGHVATVSGRARRHRVGQGTSPPCGAGHIATVSAGHVATVWAGHVATVLGRARRHHVGQGKSPPCRAGHVAAVTPLGMCVCACLRPTVPDSGASRTNRTTRGSAVRGSRMETSHHGRISTEPSHVGVVSRRVT